MQTVVGLYRSIDEANNAKQALLNEGYSGGEITVIDQSESNYGTSGSGTGEYSSGTGTSSFGTGTGTNTGSGVSGLTGSNTSITNTGSDYDRTDRDTNDTGVGSKIKHFFQNLTGHDEHTHRAYTEGVNRGGALLAVNVSDGEADRAAEVLRRSGATDIEGENGGGYGSTTGTGATNTGANAGYGNERRGAITGEEVIPVVQEELQVGKRQVERGGVRVYSRVVSQPVSESVNLHEERVVVDRRAVDRPATDADFRDAGPIEVRAMAEEAVVGKTGRVVEEVVVGKTATDRTETVEDSVRRTEVDVQAVGTGTSNRGSNTGNNF